MEKEFDFNEFIENLVLEAVKHSDGVRDLLDDYISESVGDLEERVETHSNELDSLDERIIKVEDSVLDVTDLNARMCEIEDNYATLSEMESGDTIIEDKVDDIQERLLKLEKFLPIFEALEKAKEKKPKVRDIEPSVRRVPRSLRELDRAGFINWNR